MLWTIGELVDVATTFILHAHQHYTDEAQKAVTVPYELQIHRDLNSPDECAWQDSSCHTKQICSEIKFI